MNTGIGKTKFILAALLALTVTHCGKKSSSSTSAVTPITSATTCTAGQLYSQYGCQPQCGTNAVWYSNQCVQVTTTTWPTNPTQPTNPWPTTQTNICQGSCGAGQTQMANGSCLPQYTCGSCYGFANGFCYIGAYAHYYYGY
jgi:hypothetical protein